MRRSADRFADRSAHRAAGGRTETAVPGLTHVVALIGYMGSGKSTVGKELAARLGWRFLDLDEEIEREAKMGIPEIFARFGERGFRDREHAALDRALNSGSSPDGTVVSCGGGVVVRPENLDLLARVPTVFLEEDLRFLYERTRGAGRPLAGASRDEFFERYAGREPLYRKAADLIVHPAGRNQFEIAREVAKWLKG
ncbi:Shikimate kinase [Rubrobacter radiotolerans]|uniref:Shikimate kinase n=1 Tax=Rubrobacter radiotolerans TaxID=42256 RepID=A0A023X417_RUBRA|nr:shikimate kinase [Rubrobacter radiotolerans]AHY46750.1 Shikimate kinase [Rubrobacter radiotolerans]MDX5894157.1 shikimate kinase [Rubrobacter radiotolerans]SMC05327.1 shikimate kinase [Rubrobacter radiotolerans DSM 5868]